MIAVAILPLVFMQSLAQAPPVAKVEGQVVSAMTGEPLKKASVRLQPNFARSSDGSQPTVYTMTTDAVGKFVIDGIAPGTYILSATRTGFVGGSYGAKSPGTNPTPLKLDSGQQLKDLTVTLTPQAMVFGRVVDEDGEAMPNARITTWRSGFQNGKKQLVQRGMAQSQADGTFVLGSLTGGRYFLSADAQNNTNFNTVEERGPRAGSGHDSYVTTYFPSALDTDAAAPLDLSAGSEMRGVEIRMRKSRVYEVSGTVVNSAGVSLRDEYLQLMLQPKGAQQDMFRFDQNHVAQVPPRTLKFQFKNVQPGVYVVRTQWATVTTRNADGDVVGQRQITGRMEITVGDRDLDNLTFAVTTGVDLSGQFIMEGTPQPQQPQTAAASNDQKPMVSLSPAQGPNMGNTNAQARDDGSFKIKGIDQDVYNVNVYGIPDTAYVKSISFGGTDITGKTLDLTSGSSAELKIVVSANGADVSGVVHNADGQPVPSARIQVVDDNKKIVKNATSDQNGNFKASGLAPGSYQVFVWESTGEGVIVDPDFRKAFESKVARIKVSEKSHESVDAKLISAADMEVELAKIR